MTFGPDAGKTLSKLNAGFIGKFGSSKPNGPHTISSPIATGRKERLKKLAVVITQSGFNNILQACEWIKIAVADGTQVSAFFRDESASKMSLTKVKELTFSEGYKGREAHVREILRAEKKENLQTLMKTIKESGDVKFSVCRDSINYFGIKVEELIPELDEVQHAEAFWKEEIVAADQILTF